MGQAKSWIIIAWAITSIAEQRECMGIGIGVYDPAVPALLLWLKVMPGVPGCSSGFDGFGFVISYRRVRKRVMSYAGVDPPVRSRKPTSALQPHMVRQTETWARDSVHCISGSKVK